jgi:CHAD domain-containing protein
MDEKTLFDKIVRRQVDAIAVEIQGVRKQSDIEQLHRMRVALRRLKSALSDFKEVIPEKEYAPISVGMKKFLRALGQARDMDTKIAFLKKLATEQRAAPYRAGILEIIDELSEDRNEVQPKILKYLSRAQQRKILRPTLRLKPSLDYTDITLDEWAKDRILARLEKLFSLESYVRKPACVKELHEMRIAAKNLRYTLENLQALYGRRVFPFVLSAAKVQRALGELHNFDVWIGLMKILSDSSGREPSFRRAIPFLRKECERRRQEAYSDFVKLWAGLKKKKTWARLGFFALDRI